jgi:hypothetical protein
MMSNSHYCTFVVTTNLPNNPTIFFPFFGKLISFHSNSDGASAIVPDEPNPESEPDSESKPNKSADRYTAAYTTSKASIVGNIESDFPTKWPHFHHSEQAEEYALAY